MQLFHLIGDPHLGRVFKTGVPLNRKGDRERMQFEQFETELDIDCRYNIMVGDLFNHPFVSFDVVAKVIKAYLTAAKKRPTCTFVLMAGNHDLPREVTKAGAFNILKYIFESVPNIEVATEPMSFDDHITVYPWQWTETAVNQIMNHKPNPIVVGHWDMESYGNDDSHIVPTRMLAEAGVEQIWSGHYHTKKDYVVDGITVHGTGSMQPYSHAEDPDGNLYVTMKLDDIDPSVDYSKKNVRIILKAGETLPELNCLALTAKRENSEVELVEVNLGSFSLVDTLNKQFELLEVPENVQQFIKDRLHVSA